MIPLTLWLRWIKRPHYGAYGKMRNNMLFCDKISNPVIVLIRAKKASAEQRIRHKLTQTAQPQNTQHPFTNHKGTYHVAQQRPQEGHPDQF